MAENEEKTLTLNQGEISALKKAILYLKFSCEETESLMYAGSPLINSVLTKLINVDDFGEEAISFYKERHVKNEMFISSKLERFEIERGQKLEMSVKKNSFVQCLYPFSNK